MRTEIVYGDRFLDVELPDDTQAVPPGLSLPLAPIDDVALEVGRALAAPLELPPLGELARQARRVTIAFDDPTVPCFVPIWETAISQVLEELYAAGVGREQIHLLCANALHRKFTHDELSRLIGTRLVAEHGERLTCHDAEDPENLVHLGRTAAGHDVELHRAVIDSDLLVYVNANTHRGFSGGWKSICVGLSTWRSIRWHHTPDRMTMSTVSSPLHEILDEMGRLVLDRVGPRRIFKIETVLANPLAVARVFAGSVAATRRTALELVRANIEPRRQLLEEKADVVIYGVPDWSPYAAFSFTNPILTLLSTGLGYLGGVIPALGKPGCSVILDTPCPNRWNDQHHPSYREVWERVIPATKDPEEALSRHADDFASRPEYVHAYRHEQGFHGVHPIMGLSGFVRLRHAARVFVAGIEDPATAEHLGFIPAGTVEEALERSAAFHGTRPRVALVRYPLAWNRQ